MPIILTTWFFKGGCLFEVMPYLKKFYGSSKLYIGPCQQVVYKEIRHPN